MMGRGVARSASSGQDACAIHARSPSSTARRTQFRAFSAITINTMAEKRVIQPADDTAADGGSSASPDRRDESFAPADQIGDLQRERDDYYDRLLRKTAEFDNYRKRIERERRDRADEAVTDLLLELLAVVDDFDLALTA